MSFSRGGSSESATTNEQNPITATDNAMVASEGGTITVTDGGAFNVVTDAIDAIGDVVLSAESLAKNAMSSTESIASDSINAGLDYHSQTTGFLEGTLDKVFNFVGDTVQKSQDTISGNTQALFNSAKSDSLNRSEDMQQTIRTLGMYATIGLVGYTAFRFLKK
ncbi:hypothetical protein NVP1069O_17 [Vibrio phage 1.069.O._10N.286.49.F11]|uniref:TMhelix containing protein n=7 Tax=Autolykiviridae TaxID=2184034 RepID=A0A2I7S843_9VIRU|nr:hypothetical protein KMD65_gp14 [Vibrio phage 1.008.O._10N.286.54.E5]AUR81645.1 hypothetical protein NVP1011O_16 [Vibrio phage 1.011.O._10N.286.49.B11]AUR83784.1 hypothetical protein NVP1040O_17 [Vibrio phage 1.040.O._10N.286.45.B9]AUR84663.1 hypothetical protein NVP1062O_17 [Vibrio phage 1.062.O._10N.286.55.C3]AUR85160.1 hypothetical protein NVP1069O_17 [Vibrio phage 1.069.O._10N.286.49.F11]AUR89588.1 hypothetical protein NVP1125O_17 [Vibrio phage 1.125.O._10N.286.49.F5]AUS02077.1 hypothe